MAAVVLDRYQQVCFDDYRAGKNVGIFSSAGCGKSVVIKAIVRDAVAQYGSGGVAVCSWYGAAADLIGGHTLHSFFSCGIRLLTPADFVAATKSRSGLLSKLIQVRVLVIDEVFTITGLWLAAFLRILRGIAPAGAQTHPAGGVQVIAHFVIFGYLDGTVAGDPLQTLPIDLSHTNTDELVFRTLQWRSLFRPWRGTCRRLAGNHRQRGDDAYAVLLERIRIGRHTSGDIDAVNATWDQHTDEERLLMPQLRALRSSVDSYNAEQLDKLPGEETRYDATDSNFPPDGRELQVTLQDLERRAPGCLSVKLRAPVIATRRLSSTIPTGTVGVIVATPSPHELVCSFKGERVSLTRKTWDIYSANGAVSGTREQFPVVLAWAVTIHRAQGSELNSVCIDLTRDDWACDGLVYAALSRVRFLRSLCVRGLNTRHIKVNQVSLSFWFALVDADGNE